LPTSLVKRLSRIIEIPFFNRLYFRLVDLDTSFMRLFHGNKHYYEFDFMGKSLVGNVRFSGGTKDHKVYETLAFLVDCVEFGPGDVIADIGANIGITTVVLGDLVKGKEVRIHSFEPGEQIAFLKENIARTGLEGVAFPEEVALYDRNTELTLYTYDESIVDSRVFLDDDWVNLRNKAKIHEKNVRAMTFDSFLEEKGISPERIRLIKIDCQGAEPAILSGMFQSGNIHKNFCVLMEFWPFALHKQKIDVLGYLKELQEKFEGFQFSMFQDEGEAKPLSREEFLRLDHIVGYGDNRFCDIIITPSSLGERKEEL